LLPPIGPNPNIRFGPVFRGQVSHGIRRFDRDADQGQTGGLEDVLHELVAGLPVTALMAFIVQLDACQGADGLGVTQQEIRVLAVDLIAVDAELAGVRRFNTEEYKIHTCG